MFHTDDEMYLSKAVARLPAEYRLEALGLWQTVGQWSAHQAAEGYCTLAQVHQLSPLGTRRTNTLVGLLVDVAGLWSRVDWDSQPSVLFRDWDIWQDTREQVKKRRDSWRESKRRQRAASKESADQKTAETLPKLDPNSRETSPKLSQKNGETYEPNDADLHQFRNVQRGQPPGQPPGVHNPLIPSPNLSNQSPKQLAHESNAQAANQPRPRTRTFTAMAGGDDRPPPPPPPDLGPQAAPARELVKRVIPTNHPADIRGKLAHHTARLLEDGTPPDLVEAALRLWLTKPHAGPALLPALVSEVIKTAHHQTANGRPLGTASTKAAGWLEIANQARAQAQQPNNPRGIEA